MVARRCDSLEGVVNLAPWGMRSECLEVPDSFVGAHEPARMVRYVRRHQKGERLWVDCHGVTYLSREWRKNPGRAQPGPGPQPIG
jgi:hypothetical protein